MCMLDNNKGKERPRESRADALSLVSFSLLMPSFLAVVSQRGITGCNPTRRTEAEADGSERRGAGIPPEGGAVGSSY